jgi:hypothetical protein
MDECCLKPGASASLAALLLWARTEVPLSAAAACGSGASRSSSGGATDKLTLGGFDMALTLPAKRCQSAPPLPREPRRAAGTAAARPTNWLLAAIPAGTDVREAPPICAASTPGAEASRGLRGVAADELTLRGAYRAGEARAWLRSAVSRREDDRCGSVMLPNVRAEATCEVGRLWPAADNELATRLPAKGGLPRGVAARARG